MACVTPDSLTVGLGLDCGLLRPICVWRAGLVCTWFAMDEVALRTKRSALFFI